MNPILLLWTQPWSMSTAIEGIMQDRGDFQYHRPF